MALMEGQRYGEGVRRLGLLIHLAKAAESTTPSLACLADVKSKAETVAIKTV